MTECREETITIEGKDFRVIHIPTATSGMWFVIADACECYGLVAIDIDGTVIGWKNPPDQKGKPQLEEAIIKAFKLGKYSE